MSLEELYTIERARIRKLAIHYSRIFGAEPEDLLQTGALAVCETYVRYAGSVTDEVLLTLSHRIINRMMYKFALKEYRHRKLLQLYESEAGHNEEII